ncbi:STAS/SEC14 domain-containing protein [uncultured Erythrobacter sp.]|uniref:STAS/SEC14 domain-containing protein n=1 Tax=uncultured Erythrobacter sp. TaxID=263913 RepID=UPI002608F6F4|nr:STAS/SEC14 domain-containing protein [uncultured Erythrobacter sp.]
MINIETLSPKAHRVTVMGPFHFDDAEALVAFAKERLASRERGNLLIDVTSLADFSFSAISDQLMHIPSMLQFVYSLDRIAFISDEEWMRSAARLESMLPGVTYQVYDDDEKDAALAWILEEEEAPHKGAFRELDVGRADVAAFEVVGRLDGPESDRGIAMVEERLNDPQCSKLMMVIRHWHGFEAELLFTPKLMASKLRLIDKIDRYAVVGGPSWVGSVAQTIGMLIKPEIKAFKLDEQDEALEWLSEALVEAV